MLPKHVAAFAAFVALAWGAAVCEVAVGAEESPNYFDLYALKRQYMESVIDPLKLEGRSARVAFDALVSLGHRCRVAPEEAYGLKYSSGDDPVRLPPAVVCEGKLVPGVEEFPQIIVTLAVNWPRHGKTMEEVLSMIDSATVERVRGVPLPAPKHSDEYSSHRRESEAALRKWLKKLKLVDRPADVAVATMMTNGYSCGVESEGSTSQQAQALEGKDARFVVCTAPWFRNIKHCYSAVARFEITGDVPSAGHEAKLLWSKKHSVKSVGLACEAPATN